MSKDIQDAYNAWAEQYDSNHNKTRDLEAIALRSSLAEINFRTCLEIGCGTGKNTEFLMAKAVSVTAVDLSEEMLAKAQEKITSERVQFIQADITQDWDFGVNQFDFISYSLVLEHIEDLDHVFKESARALSTDGHIYIGELHPFKQYSGSKARFETESGTQILRCYNHHISDFIHIAQRHGLSLIAFDEYFDNDNRDEIPRILILVFKKQGD